MSFRAARVLYFIFVERDMNEKELQLERWLSEGDIAQISRELTAEKKESKITALLKCLIRIYYVETENGVENNVFHYSRNLKELTEHYTKIKLLLRRIEYNVGDEEEFYTYCEVQKVSQYVIAQILLNNIFHAKTVCRKITDNYAKQEGWHSDRVLYYRKLEGQLEDISE